MSHLNSHPSQEPIESSAPVEDGDKVYKKGPFAGLTPNVIRLGLVSFFVDISSEMLYPLVPIFLTVVLGAPMAALGIIEGCAEFTASILKTVSGRWSDRTGRRRPFVLAGYGLSALTKPLIALATAWPMVLVARVGDRFGKGLRSSPRDALLADSIDKQYRGKAFGWHRAMDTSGAVLGPLVAIAYLLLVGETTSALRWIFVLAFVPAVVGSMLVLLVHERRREPASPAKPLARIGWSALPRNFRMYLIAWGAFSLVNSSDMFILAHARGVFDAAGLAQPAVLAVLAYVVYNVVYAASSPWLGSLSDRLPRKLVLAGGLTIFAIVYGGLAGAFESWHFWPLLALYGLYTAATEGVGKALAVDLVSPEIRASALGLLGTVTGLCMLLASVAAGLLYSYVGPWAAFAYGSIGSLVAAVLMIVLVQPEK